MHGYMAAWCENTVRFQSESMRVGRALVASAPPLGGLGQCLSFTDHVLQHDHNPENVVNRCDNAGMLTLVDLEQ